jgi:hypothetical protein
VHEIISFLLDRSSLPATSAPPARIPWTACTGTGPRPDAASGRACVRPVHQGFGLASGPGHRGLGCVPMILKIPLVTADNSHGGFIRR